MMLCIATAGAIVSLAASSFTLSWTHSVERTEWREHWVVGQGALHLVEASVQGSGAGIAVPPDARLEAGRWRYKPAIPPLPELVLAASGMTTSPWQLCVPGGECHMLGEEPGQDTRLWVAEVCSQNEF